MLTFALAQRVSATAREAREPPCLQRVPREADDGIRTHDLLHGKRVVGTGSAAHESRTVERNPAALTAGPTITETLSFTGDSLGFGHWGRALVPNRALASDVTQPLPMSFRRVIEAGILNPPF